MNDTREVFLHGGKQELSVVGNNNSIMEYVYAIVYLGGICATVSVSVSIILMAILYKSLELWAVIVAGLIAFCILTILFTAVSVWAVSLLIKLNTQQPRGEDGRFIPVYDRGQHSFDLFSAARRKKKGASR